MTDVWIEHAAIKSALGEGLEQNFDAMLAGRTAFSAPAHFDGRGRLLAVCHDLDQPGDQPTGPSRAETLLLRLRPQLPERLPERLYLATTVGAIDRLETAGALKPGGTPPETSRALLAGARRIFAARQAWLVAAACSSGQYAITAATTAIRRGQCRDALVIGCDMASEFVTAGFASLGALTATTPRPYSLDRDGMALGEAAAAVVLTSRPEHPRGRIAGWGETGDAAHITAPDRSGAWLAKAGKAALAGHIPAAVIGHGTGTVYNDEAELNALATLFPDAALPPLFSLKANIGHTLGATGVVQAIIATVALQRRQLPPQAGLTTPDPRAAGAVSTAPAALRRGGVLSLNAGFGGINHALLIAEAP
ncbi:MAG: beta-ketoacyl synthase N-terminal-like domain-containing protein [Lentisphaeria bacterium]|nr:beta-ketoacyl synthase N-terminal-like domain-containing protein [Lentisphaeria bacterium]